MKNKRKGEEATICLELTLEDAYDLATMLAALASAIEDSGKEPPEAIGALEVALGQLTYKIGEARRQGKRRATRRK